MKNNWFDKLSLGNQRLISCGLFGVLMVIAVRIAFGSDLALKTANTQLILSDSADRLANLLDCLINLYYVARVLSAIAIKF